MKLLNHKGVHFSRDAAVFRHHYSVLKLIVMTAFFSGFLFYCWRDRVFPTGVLIFSSGGILLFFFMFWKAYFKSLSKKNNWLLGFDSGKVYLSFRSFHNSHFNEGPDDAVVLELAIDEIRAVRKRTDKMVYKRYKGNHRHGSYVYLDILLKGECPAEVKAAIARERGLSRTGHGKVHHYPVTLHSDRSLQLEWRSPSTAIRPDIETCLGIFASQVERTEDTLEQLDFRREVPADETDRMLKKLLARGDIMAAESIVRETFGVTSGEAMAYLESLMDEAGSGEGPSSNRR